MLDVAAIEKVVEALAQVKASGGRVFFLGVGGSAANCSHAVNDFRKLAGMECYAPTDNVSELTARINDDGWESIFVEWLKVSRLGRQDAVFIFSVGGGSVERNISPNLVAAAQHAKSMGAKVIGILGRDGGYHRVGRGCIRHRSDGQSGDRYSAHRSFPSRHLASVGFSPAAQNEPDEMGIGANMSLGANRRAPPSFWIATGSSTARSFATERRFHRSPLQDLEILAGVSEALIALKAHGYTIVVVTNQPDVARGTLLEESIEGIHRRLEDELAIDAIMTCFHDDADDCACRKPKPGLLLQAARDLVH